jgi:vitamin B12 transporter
MAGYGLLALYASWSFSPEFAFSARVNNATDKRYVLAQGYNTAPRQFVLSLDATWR